MQNFARTAKISTKVAGGGYFFRSPVFSRSRFTKNRNEDVKTGQNKRDKRRV